MLAAVFLGPGSLELREVPRPECPQGGALLKVRACAICGSDLRIVRAGHKAIDPPRIIGHEVVGTVVESRHSAAAEGSRVTVAPAVGCGQCQACGAGRPNRCDSLRTIGYAWDGGFAEYLAVPPEALDQRSLCLVPPGLSDATATLAEPLACVLNGQELVGVGPGDYVAVAGGGPIGCLHGLLLQARGAQLAVLVEPRAERRHAAAKLGLAPTSADWGQTRWFLMGSPTVAIVAASVPSLYHDAIYWVGKGGRVSYFAGLPPDEKLTALPANHLHYSEVTVVGAHGSTPDQNRQALALLASGRVRADSMVSASYPLERIDEALEAAASGAELKVLVSLDS